MRLRSAVGAGVVLVAVISAVIVLRGHSAPSGLPATAAESSAPTPAPVVDPRAQLLTDRFRHTALLPTGIRFTDDPNSPPGFVFRRFADIENGQNLPRYAAEGSVVRNVDNVVLDHILVTIWRTSGHTPTELAKCDATGQFGGASCTEKSFPNGANAKVVRNPVFAQTVASDSPTGSPPGMQTELQAVYPNGTLLSVTLYSMNGAGIPLDDAAMLRLATIPGVSGPG